MIAVQESFGQVIIPYGINIAQEFVDLLNGLSLLLIPFGAMLVKCFFEARAQGLDEGSPAVLAIKTAESSFWSMFVVMWLFVLPWETANSEVKFQTYVCGLNSETNALSEMYSNRPEIQKVALDITTRPAHLPVGIGLANNIGIGSAESLSGTMPCSSKLAKFDASFAESYINIQNDALISNLKNFNNQCYIPAMDRVSKGITTGNSKITEPYNKENNFFFGFNAMSGYTGQLQTPELTPLVFQIKDTSFHGVIKDEYKPDNYSEFPLFFTNETDNLLIDCTEAANEYKWQLIDIVEDEFSEQVDTIFNSMSVLPQSSSSGTPHNVTRSEVLLSFVQQAMMDSVAGKKSIVEAGPHIAKNESQSAIDYYVDMAITTKDNLLGNTKGSLGEIVTSMGFGVETLKKASERTNLYLIIPLITSIVLMVVYAASPVIFLMSGYSWEMVFNQIFLFFYLAMIYFVLNLSFIISNVFWLLADSYYGGVGIHSNAALAINYMALAVPIFAIIAWTAICLIAGLKLGPFVSGFFLANGVAAAKAGNSFIQNGISPPRVGGSSKRQVGGDS
ncbi:hypothetical protein [Enterovibrio norvegicus]|uniref:hypothetical protein n=1 Tax=Enterovibrio norvegicus TaxID=188144 RepID=UPI000C8576B4|nr:hypothetical protein [Enterovibrio norvegicus]PMH64460.1 hypothetical protein BCU62_15510 [Enterovibrio norvegicus]